MSEKSYLPDNFILTDEFTRAFDLMENTNECIFLTGKAGTGKSTLIEYFREKTKKNVVYLAPTGIAALNIRGKTIHSFFKFPPHLIIADEIHENVYRKETLEIFKKVDTIIIDEISMTRGDAIDGVDYILRLKRRKQQRKPFGGVQMIFVGDIFQLPPIVSAKEPITFSGGLVRSETKTLKEYFDDVYGGRYFFNAPSFKQTHFHYIELQHVFRQKDERFINLLNAVRENRITVKDLSLLNKRSLSHTFKADDIRIRLCTTNAKVNAINTQRMDNINTKEYMYEAEFDGKFAEQFSEKDYPVEKKLLLKKGAQVMMVRNDFNRKWVNGSMGIINQLSDDEIKVEINDHIYTVEPEIWEAYEYEYNLGSQKISSNAVGTFTQYPIKLAWAVTIHKSQGRTFDNVTIDLERGAFEHGQTYVALSRCTSLAGIVLERPVRRSDIILDQQVVEFIDAISHNKNLYKIN